MASTLGRMTCAPALGAVLGLWGLVGFAEPRLRCEVEHGGTTQNLEAAPVGDPYRVERVDVGGRFRFKAVVVGDAGRVEYVAIYTWYRWEGREILLHEAKYSDPQPGPEGAPDRLTGRQFLYAPGRERELKYQCALVESAR
jgi:hypothetical protein